MAAGPQHIEVTGAKELRRALKRMDHDVRDLTRINKAAAEMVASRARERAPVLTRRLRKSVKARATKTAGRVQAGGGLVVYAGPIHFGWHRRHIVPQPFIFDALDERRGEVVHLYEKRVAELVLRVGRETP